MSNDSESDTNDEAVEAEILEEEMAEEDSVEDEVAEESPVEEVESGFQDGDFIELDYTARTVEDGALVDTTDPDVAEEEGVGEDQEFSPRTIVLGQGHLFQQVEDDISGKEVGGSATVTVSAENAFGAYDESEVRTVSKDKIPEDDRYPGGHVTVDGEHGHVETIIGGRARVDFNHMLAGEDIEYEYEILDEVDDREERAQGLLSMFLDVDLDVWFQTDTVEEERLVESDVEAEDADADDTDAEDSVDESSDEGASGEDEEPEFETVEVDSETLYIEATPQLTMNQQWMMGKTQIAQQLTQFLDIDRVVVQEELGGMGAMGGLGGMGGMGGSSDADIEAALEEADIDADELIEDIETAEE